MISANLEVIWEMSVKTKKPERIVDKLGPFTYSYISITRIPGVKLPEDCKDPIIIQSFPEINSKAYLTNKWDIHCFHMDQNTAIGALLFTKLIGSRRFMKVFAIWNNILVRVFGPSWTFKRNLSRETKAALKRRHKDHSGPGCYLVYKAEGELIEPANLRTARRFENIGFGFDVIDGQPYRAIHARAIHSTATALSLALADTTGSPEIQSIGDVIFLKGRGDLIFYCKSITFGAAGLVVTTFTDKQIIEKCSKYLPILLSDTKIEASVALFVQSQRKSNDNLRAFISAWAALELLVNRLERLYRVKWQDLLERSSGSLPDWDKDLSRVCPKDYWLRDRFFAVSCVLEIKSAQTDSEIFSHANKMRSGFYHRGEVDDKDLPTSDVQSLYRKYLRLGFMSAADDA